MGLIMSETTTTREHGITWARTGGPKPGATIPGEFLDTIAPDTWRQHDAQAAYDPDAVPLQNVPNPCEGDDDVRPVPGAGPVVWLAGGVALLAVLAAWWLLA